MERDTSRRKVGEINVSPFEGNQLTTTQSRRGFQKHHHAETRCQLLQKALDLACLQNFGSPVTLCALAHEGNRISSLLKPFIAYCVIEQYAEQTSNLRFGCVGEWVAISTLQRPQPTLNRQSPDGADTHFSPVRSYPPC